MAIIARLPILRIWPARLSLGAALQRRADDNENVVGIIAVLLTLAAAAWRIPKARHHPEDGAQLSETLDMIPYAV
jgi:hypothetical protein